MQHKCKVTVLATTVNEELQREYLADPETDEERAWLAAQDFSNSADDAYTG
jgi:hypothetical protein